MVEARFFAFLQELAANNNRDWFTANKGRYERDVRDPMLALIAALRPGLEDVSPHIVVDARPQGGSLFRIYRDTRFAADKTPYKTHMAAQFRHRATAGEVHAPGYYLHLGAEDCYFACGLWRPEAELVRKVRAAILADTDGWKASVDALGDLQREGEKLKRPPTGVPADHPLVEDLKLKDFIAVGNFTRAEVSGPGFVDRYVATARQAAPFMAFLSRAGGLPF